MCLYPRLIKNRKYTSNKKNGGVIPAVLDERTKLVPIGCQRCIECKKQKANSWRARLLEDIQTYKNGKFITLTFSNDSIKKLYEEIDKTLEGYEIDNQIATLAVRRWLERHRKKYGKSIRHWIVTELGHKGTENIHMHGIIWTDLDMSEIERLWGYGFIWKGYKKLGRYINYVNEATINYCVKYLTKTDVKHKTYNPKMLVSHGIGNNYISTYNSRKNRYHGKDTEESYKTRSGHKIGLPVYWRNKIYTEQEREQLWIHKLDKKTRWILGKEIDISIDDKIYWQTLKHARELNKQLGYGDDSKNWSREIYEKQRRTIIIKERMKNVNET